MRTSLLDLKKYNMTYLETASMYVRKLKLQWLDRGLIGPHVLELRYSPVS